MQEMNPVLKAIYDRRAVRKYKDQRIRSEDLETILDAGRMAPSAINKQPWTFHVLQDPKLIATYSAAIIEEGKFAMIKEGIKEAAHALLHPSSFTLKDGMDFFKGEDPIFHKATLLMFISSPKSNSWAPLDIGMCAQNMMLAAHSLGIASCPIGLGTFIEKTKYYKDLQVPSGNHINLSIGFGYADDTPKIHERKKDNVVFVN